VNDSDVLAIQRLLSDFAWHADLGEADLLSSLFTEDGVLHVGGKDLCGRQEIADDSRRRFLTAGRKTRHVWSNLRVEGEGQDTARATLVQLTYEQTGAGDKTEVRVNDMADVLRKGADGKWRFARRTVTRQMSLHA
jgi:uncharacterized protein (TIGR02246 family)